MTNPEHLRLAVLKIEGALAKLNSAKRQLLYGKSDQHIRFAMMLAELEEIHAILTDPECTPELYEVGDSE